MSTGSTIICVMTTVKLVLDKRRKKKSGAYPLVIRIRKTGKYVDVLTNQDAISGKVIYKRGILSMNSISQIPDQDIIVFPNPLSTSLTIKSNLLSSSYKIYNVLGEIVQTGVLTSLQTEVNLSALPNGTYQLIIGKDQLKSFQIIKNN